MKKNIRTRGEIINEIIQYFEDNTDVFNAAIEELDGYNGYLGDDRVFPMEYIDEFYHNCDPLELLNRAYFGHDADSYTTDSHGNRHYSEFNPNRDYFYYNGYGNLISTDYPDYSAHNDSYAIEAMLEHIDYIDEVQSLDDLMELFNELKEAIENEK